MRRSRSFGLFVLSLCAAGCSGGLPDGTTPSVVTTSAAPAPASATSALPTATTTTSSAAPSASAAVAPEPPKPASSEPHTGPLATFHDALRELASGRRHEHVRIAWLGDSHAQADFWTGSLRSELQQRFGDGGPGFVHLGFKGYRHGGTHIDVHGSWRMRPKKPSTTEASGDGVFGLGGVLTAGYADEPWASISLTDAGLEGKKVRWDVCHKWGNRRAEYVLELGAGESPARRKLHPDATTGVLEHVSFTTEGLATLRVRVNDIGVEFCGVVIEADPTTQPGVVVDTLGINGARYATALAWDAAAWKRESTRRTPELYVIEYGGNEAGDPNFRPASYKKNLLAVIARVRAVRADASCLVIGLTERNDAEQKIVPVRDVQREAAAEAGCMFWDSFEQMGGAGSMRLWQADGRGADDGVHLKPKGYAELGQKLVADLLAGYHGPEKPTAE